MKGRQSVGYQGIQAKSMVPRIMAAKKGELREVGQKETRRVSIQLTYSFYCYH